MTYQRACFILILLKAISPSKQDDVCILPDGNTQSTCMPPHHCNSYMNFLKPYGTQYPPVNVQNYIRSHLCTNKKDICCPKEMKIPTTMAPAPPQNIKMMTPQPVITTTEYRTTTTEKIEWRSNDGGEKCILPNSTNESTCIRLMNCNYFRNIIRAHKNTPPNEVKQNIGAHSCRPTGNFVCCPENANVETFIQINEAILENPIKSEIMINILTHGESRADSETATEQNNLTANSPLLDLISIALTTTTEPAISTTEIVNVSAVAISLPDSKCILPNSTIQSVCVRFARCDHFSDIIKEHGGKPTADVIQNINAHKCTENDHVCCPDDKYLPTTTAMPITTTLFIDNLKKTDLNALQNNRNMNLINERSCGVSSSDRITGGVDAQVFEFPWAVLLGYKTGSGISWNCGGTLIAKQFVLTAAHCINNDLTVVRLGEHTISNITDCKLPDNCADPVQDIVIETTLKHPDYKSSIKINDIALIKLNYAANMSQSVGTVCLPTEIRANLDTFKRMKYPFTICGWGKIGNESMRADVLQKAFVPYVEHEDCVKKFEGHTNIRVHKSYLCAGGHNKTDTCKGDSGGGITGISIIGKVLTPRTTLYGVVSAGVACEKSEAIFPGVYTNIEYYLDWILDNMS